MNARPGVWWAVLGLVVSAFTAYPGVARADSLLVFVGGQAGTGESGSELANRVRGELVADGFRVEPVGPTPQPERMAFMRDRARGAGGPIAVGLFMDEASGGLDIYLVDTLSGRTGVTHVDRPTPEETPEVEARHAVDFLRASLLDFAIAGLRDAAAKRPTEAPAGSVEPGARPAPARWAMEGGVGVVAGFAGIGASVAPVLRLRFAANRNLQFWLTGAGLGSDPSVRTDHGTAAVKQAVGLVEGTAFLGTSRWLRPFLTLGAGTYYAGVTGTGIPPYQGESNHTISFAVDGGLGLSTSITPRVDLSLEAQVVLAEPGVAVRLVDEDAARLGQPAVFISLTLADWI
jgi:hypothetical protein